MKHTSIILTKKNANQIAGRINKFIENRICYAWAILDGKWSTTNKKYKSLMDCNLYYSKAIIDEISKLGIIIKECIYPRPRIYFPFNSRIRFYGDKIIIQTPASIRGDVVDRYWYITIQP